MRRNNVLFLFILLFPSVVSTQFQIGHDFYGESYNDMNDHSISTSKDGNVIAIGAYKNSGNGTWSGHVRVWKWDGLKFDQLGLDIDGNGIEGIGSTVSLSEDGSILAVGNQYAPYFIQLYHWDGNDWTLRGDRIENIEKLVYSMSLSGDGNRLVIGSPFYYTTLNQYIGKISAFEYTGTEWTQLGSSFVGNASTGKIGERVTISTDGSTIAFGTYKNYSKVLRWNGIEWQQLGPDFTQDGFLYRMTGMDLSSDGNRVLFATRQHYYTSTALRFYGKAEVFKWTNNLWSQIGSDISLGTGAEYFGSQENSVSISDDGRVIAIGNISYRKIHIFGLVNNNWQQQCPPIGITFDDEYFGHNTELSGDGSRVVGSGWVKGAVYQLSTNCASNRTMAHWVGTVNSNWDEPMNWQEGSFPSYCHDVMITAEGLEPVLYNVNVTLRSLELAPNTNMKLLSNSSLRITEQN